MLAAALVVVAITIAARWLSVVVPMTALKSVFDLPRGSARVLVWGGLRGGISVALALSLPSGPEREVILGFTYVVVAFSILVQGLSIGWVVRKWVDRGAR
jgi:CPA1 family monovalent cation:H+ antiporter